MRVLAGVPVLFCFLAVALLNADDKPEPKPDEPTAAEMAVFELTNKEREKQNLPLLKLDPTLLQAARAHSENMAKQMKLNHVLDGKRPNDRIKEAGYRYRTCGENIFSGSPRLATPEKALDTWMKSPGHRANILKRDYTEIGVGIARGARGELYFTQVFATPLKRK